MMVHGESGQWDEQFLANVGGTAGEITTLVPVITGAGVFCFV
jgi:Na+-transporting NADH:ubiquinone oxidoreductase subunit NqrB